MVSKKKGFLAFFSKKKFYHQINTYDISKDSSLHEKLESWNQKFFYQRFFEITLKETLEIAFFSHRAALSAGISANLDEKNPRIFFGLF